MLKQILAGGFWTAMKASRAALHSFPSAAHTPSCHSRIVSTRDMARWERLVGSPAAPWVLPLSSSFPVVLLRLSPAPFCPYFCLPAACVANLAGSGLAHVSETAPGWGSGAEAASAADSFHAVLPWVAHQVLSGSCSSPLRVFLLRVFHEKPWILSAGWLISQI